MKKGMKLALGLAVLLMAAASPAVYAGDAELSAESLKCLQCHEKKGTFFKFGNGDKVQTYVSPAKYKSSVHSSLTCTRCHTDFSTDAHPARRFATRDQYRIRASAVCRGCHTAEQIKAKPIHANLLLREKEGISSICTDCHDAHSGNPVAGGKVIKGEKQYCMSCHQHEMSMTCRNDEKIPLTVEMSTAEDNAHDKLRCSDCHYGFSSEEHPKRNFRSRRDYTITASESCRRCHFDKYTKTLDSVHYTVLSQGNLSAPVCNDCHGSHAIHHITRGVKGRTITTQKCRKCHPGVYEVYAKSVHGNALFNEQNQDVPVCIDCHTAHNIDNPLTLEYHEKIPQMCGNCHANPAIVSKYGLSTGVLNAYLSDFHGVTLGLYRKQREQLYKPARPIAVCTDCHGTHNITGAASSDPVVVKANLVKRCQKCHKDANENFPNAWLSHYKPSLSKYPMIFLVNTAYRIFIPLMALGFVLQIFLHIWRYAVNR
ncbi:MAG: cytochrome c3 family protein [Deltaproteobacteria bacterium]